MKNYNQIIKMIENEEKNNIQWMNILRIAINSSPKEAKKVIKKLTKMIKRLVT